MTAIARRLSPAAAAPFTLPTATLLLVPFALLGIVGTMSPFYALGAVLGIVFVVIAVRSLAAGVALFTVTTFFTHLPGTGSGSAIEVTGSKAAGAVLALVWFLLLIRRNDVPFLLADQPLLGFSLIGFQVWALGTALWAQDPGLAVTSSLRYGQNFLLVFVMYSALREPRHFRWLVWAFISAALVSLVIAFASGPQENDPRQTALVHSSRLTGRYGAGDPNYFAALLLPAIVFVAFLLVSERRRAAKLALPTLAGLFMVGLFQTESRGGLIALLTTALLSLFLAGRWRSRALLATALVTIVGVTYFGAIASPESRARVTRISAQDSSGRDDLWRIGLNMAADHPVLGVGAGNFTRVSPRYAARPPDIVSVNFVVDTPKVTHNTYLNILDELGIPGIALLAVIVGSTFAAGFAGIRALNQSRALRMETLARAIVLGAMGMLVASFFFSGEYQKQLWLLLGAVAALPSVARIVAEGREQPAARTQRPATSPGVA
jgi:putative inorganic carbon (hco3(-)) transporter